MSKLGEIAEKGEENEKENIVEEGKFQEEADDQEDDKLMDIDNNLFEEVQQSVVEEPEEGEEEDLPNFDLKDLEDLRNQNKPTIFDCDQNYEFAIKDKNGNYNKGERIDVFIKNYLMKFDMEKSLKVFEQEFYEKLSKKEILLEDIGDVPQIYIESEEIQKKIGSLQKDLDSAKISAAEAKSHYIILNRTKENEKIRHRRVQQEKQLLIKEIEKLKKVYENDKKIYEDLDKKYKSVTEKTVFIDSRIVRERQAVDNLDIQVGKLQKALDDLKKTKQTEPETKDANLIKEELKGNKIISWTPFPNPPTDLPDFSAINPPSNRMTVFKSFPGHLSGVTSIDFHPKKAIIATASDDKTWKLWKFPTGELLMHGEGHSDWISGVAFHPDGILLGTCGGDATIKIWNILKEKCVHTIIDHADPVWKIKFNYSGEFLLTACMDHTIRLFDLNNYKARISYRAHVDSVNAINFLYMSNSFVSASADKTVSLWDIRSNICTQTFYGHNNAVNCAMATPNGDIIASCDADGVVKFWDVRMIREIGSYEECKQSANCLCFDKSGTVLAVGYDDNNIRIFPTGKKSDVVFKGHDDAVLDLMYDPNNMSLLSASADRSFKIWQ
ncbi:MAG: hypothetical protein MJ252_07880 [archaeon]|nr:hypothetical protein [archaeon]